jgi:hypothetical protein
MRATDRPIAAILRFSAVPIVVSVYTSGLGGRRLTQTVRRRITASSIPSGRLRLSGRMLIGMDALRSQDLQPYAGRSQEHRSGCPSGQTVGALRSSRKRLTHDIVRNHRGLEQGADACRSQEHGADAHRSQAVGVDACRSACRSGLSVEVSVHISRRRLTHACSRRLNRGVFARNRHVSTFPVVSLFASPPRLMLTVRAQPCSAVPPSEPAGRMVYYKEQPKRLRAEEIA